MKNLKRVLENMKTLENVIKTNAPRGRGIDFGYVNIRVEHYSKGNENKIIFENAYRCRNEYGYRDGVVAFRVVVGANLSPNVHLLDLTNAGRYRTSKYDLRSYLQSIYADYVNNDEQFLELLIKIL